MSLITKITSSNILKNSEKKKIENISAVIANLSENENIVFHSVVHSNNANELYVTHAKNEFSCLQKLQNEGLLHVRVSPDETEISAWITSNVKEHPDFSYLAGFTIPGTRWMWIASWFTMNNDTISYPVYKTGNIIALPYEDKYSLYNRAEKRAGKVLETNRGKAFLHSLALEENEEVF